MSAMDWTRSGMSAKHWQDGPIPGRMTWNIAHLLHLHTAGTGSCASIMLCSSQSESVAVLRLHTPSRLLASHQISSNPGVPTARVNLRQNQRFTRGAVRKSQPRLVLDIWTWTCASCCSGWKMRTHEVIAAITLWLAVLLWVFGQGKEDQASIEQLQDGHLQLQTIQPHRRIVDKLGVCNILCLQHGLTPCCCACGVPHMR